MRRSLTAAISITALIGVMAATAMPSAPPVAATVSTHFVEFDEGPPGPLGSVAFIGDSVGIGAGRFAPSLPDHLIARGWGPIRFHAVDGKRTGYPPGWPDYFNAVPMIDQWQASGWDSDTWIVNLGANDSGFCSRDVACARASIMLVVDAIGPGHRIWWPKITRFYTMQHQADAWNTALDQIAAERDDFWTWDWPSVMRGRPDVYASYDNTHLYPDGYRQRSLAMADAFTSAVARAQRVGTDAATPTAAAARARVLPIDPTRLLDTRVDAPLRLPAGGVATVHLGDDVPASATAVAVNVAAVDPAAPGFLTAYPCHAARPATSMVNTIGRTRSASAIVALSPDATLCVFSSAESDVIVDLQAVLVPHGSADTAGLMPLTVPERLVDTRVTGRRPLLTVPVAAGAAMAAVTITATEVLAPGFVTAYPCGTPRPEVSNVNVLPGDTHAGAAFVRVGADDEICIYASSPMDVIVDLTATFAAGAGMSYVAAAPQRMLDTRSGLGGWSPVHGSGQTLDVGVAPVNAGAVSGTVSVVTPSAPTFVAAAPCSSEPHISSVNAAPGDVVANGLTSGVTGGRLCLTARAAGHTLFDITGWWVVD